jgi:hypothetical protein
MPEFLRIRSLSLSMVVLMLLLIWDFLFPQRAASVPRYERWVPSYTDFIDLGFTTSFAFSPTDTMPLTRRAKLLMLLQSVISIITLTGIAGSAINILAGAH